MSRAALLTILAIVAAILLAASPMPGKTTHLGVASNVLVNLQTHQMPNNNTGGHPFYYDRSSQPFGPIPDNTSFVVTDIIIHPSSSDPSASYFVISANTTPTGRNFSSSAHPAEIQLIGDFTKGAGLSSGQPAFYGLARRSLSHA
jgi:hypothetical protein